MTAYLNRRAVKKLCHEHGKQASGDYIDRLDRMIESKILAHICLTGRRRLDPDLVTMGMKPIGRSIVGLALIFLFLQAASALSGPAIKITHYSPGPECCGKWADGFTATGKPAVPGVCAVSRDPGKRLFPLGSIIEVPGYGRLRVEDVGGAVQSGQLDVLVREYREAIKLGVKWIQLDEIRVLRRGR